MRLDPAYFRHSVGNQAPIWPFELKRASLQARGLVGWWPFSEGAGNKARDLAGKFDFDTFSNGPAWAVNALGRVLNTGNNSNSRLQRSTNIDGTALAISGDISFALWFKTPATWGPFRYLLDTNNDNGTDGWTIQTDNPSTSGMSVTLGGIGADVFFADAELQLNKIHHLVVTRVGASVSIYIDGRLAETVNTFGTGSIAYSGSKLTLGASATADNVEANIDVKDFRVYSRELSASDVWALYDPATRWDLYREFRVPRVWPASGGAVSRTAIGSLQAVLRRQDSFFASIDAALRAEMVLSALAGAALEKSSSGNSSLDLAVQILGQAQADLDTALIRVFGLDAGLDANLAMLGASQRTAALDGAIRQVNLLSGTLEAALRAPKFDTAVLDAWLALSLEGASGIDAVTQRAGQLSSTALQGILRASPGRAAALDAIIGLVVAAAVSRTQKIGARSGHMVPSGLRRSAIPSSNRRH